VAVAQEGAELVAQGSDAVSPTTVESIGVHRRVPWRGPAGWWVPWGVGRGSGGGGATR
jgi:hypothetical protein